MEQLAVVAKHDHKAKSDLSNIVPLPEDHKVSHLSHLAEGAVNIIDKVEHGFEGTVQHIEMIGKEAKYLLPQAPPPSPEEVASAREFNNFWYSKKLRGPKDYANGVLPASTPLQKYEQYRELEPPPHIPTLATSTRLNNGIKISMSEGREIVALEAYQNPAGHPKIKKHSITGLAMREQADNKHFVNLVNIFALFSQTTGSCMIRCGVIENDWTCMQLCAVFNWVNQYAQKFLGSSKQRMLSVQLNDPGIAGFGEGSLIEGQSAQIKKLDQMLRIQLSDTPTVAHANVPVDGFSRVIPLQERYSHGLSLEATKTLLTWAIKDWHPESTPPKLKKALDAFNSLSEGLQGVKDTRNAKPFGHFLRHHGNPMPCLDDYYKSLTSEKTPPAELFTFKLLHHLTAIQTGKWKKYEYQPTRPAQETAILFLLTYVLNAILQMNCYSGVDRTGFEAALAYAIDRLIEAGIQKGKEPYAAAEFAYEFLMSFETRVEQMSKAIKEAINHNEEGFNFKEWLDGPGADYKDIVSFQNEVVSYVQGVSQQVVYRSSGVLGEKWGDKLENNSWIPYLPMFMFDAKTQAWFRVIGDDRRFTPAGRAVFLGQESARQG